MDYGHYPDYSSSYKSTWGSIRLSAMVFIAGLLAGAALAFLFGIPQFNPRRDTINPDVFANGLGIYVFNEGKYNLLVWKKKIVAGPDTPPDPKDIAEASRAAIVVGPDVRFFAYGLDISRWPVVPPYAMAFCIVRNEKTIDGIYPVRVMPMDRARGPIFELLLPTVVENLKSGAQPYLFWTLNYQYSCNDGWTFKFDRGR
jgi:hypothetical protein